MFGISGLMKFYFMPGVTDMRLGYYRLTEIVRTQYGRNPKNGDCYFFISKDQRRIRIFRYECEAYYLYEKYYNKGITFMKVNYDFEAGISSYKMEWGDLVRLLECPVRKVFKSTSNKG